jgi:methionyl aminopeptidase
VADSAVTVGVGKISEEAEKLLDATEGSLYEGILRMIPGNHLGDISSAIQVFAEARGFYLTKQYTGHGVGRSMWEAPQVPNYGTAGTGLKLKAGMTLAIEPMLLIGTEDTKVMKDGWSVSSANRKLTGHFEHSIAITENGPMITTLLDDDEPPVVFNPENKNKVLKKS